MTDYDAVLRQYDTSDEPTDGRAVPAVRLRTLREILTDPLATASPLAIVPRLAWQGRVTLLAAREKDGKTTLAAAAASAVSAGRPFLGEPTTAGPVLWVMAEGHPHDLARHGTTFGANEDQFHVLERPREPLDELAAAIVQLKPVFVLVDALATFFGEEIEDPGKSSIWVPRLATLARFAQEGPLGMLLLHHARRSDGAYRDSSAIGAGVDVILEMAVGEEPLIRKVRARARWAMTDFALRLESDRYALASGELSVDAKVLLYVEQHPRASGKAVREGVGGKAADIDVALARLLAQRAIRDEGDGQRHAYVIAGGVVPQGIENSGRDDPHRPSQLVVGQWRDEVRDEGSSLFQTPSGTYPPAPSEATCTRCGRPCERGPWRKQSCNACALALGQREAAERLPGKGDAARLEDESAEDPDAAMRTTLREGA